MRRDLGPCSTTSCTANAIAFLSRAGNPAWLNIITGPRAQWLADGELVPELEVLACAEHARAALNELLHDALPQRTTTDD